jgi:hypothetical protein
MDGERLEHPDKWAGETFGTTELGICGVQIA